MSKKNLFKQQVLVLLAAGVIIASAVSTTLYFTGFFSGGAPAGSVVDGYQNVTFTDASLACQTYTRERYADRMQTLTLDDHSSRYEDASKLYKIFLQLKMRKANDSPHPEPYWVNCFVSATNGNITEFEVGEARNAPRKPIRKDPDKGTISWF